MGMSKKWEMFNRNFGKAWLRKSLIWLQAVLQRRDNCCNLLLLFQYPSYQFLVVQDLFNLTRKCKNILCNGQAIFFFEIVAPVLAWLGRAAIGKFRDVFSFGSANLNSRSRSTFFCVSFLATVRLD